MVCREFSDGVSHLSPRRIAEDYDGGSAMKLPVVVYATGGVAEGLHFQKRRDIC